MTALIESAQQDAKNGHAKMLSKKDAARVNALAAKCGAASSEMSVSSEHEQASHCRCNTVMYDSSSDFKADVSFVREQNFVARRNTPLTRAWLAA